jgi:hypothetical protein
MLAKATRNQTRNQTPSTIKCLPKPRQLHQTRRVEPLCPASPALSPVETGGINSPLPANRQPTAPPAPGRRKSLARSLQQRRALLQESAISAHRHVFFARCPALRLPPPTCSGPTENPTAFPLTKKPLLTHLPRFSFQILRFPRHPVIGACSPGIAWGAALYAGIAWGAALYAGIGWGAALYAGIAWGAALYAGIAWGAALYARIAWRKVS